MGIVPLRVPPAPPPKRYYTGPAVIAALWNQDVRTPVTLRAQRPAPCEHCGNDSDDRDRRGCCVGCGGSRPPALEV
jgi:hypothetical protein